MTDEPTRNGNGTTSRWQLIALTSGVLVTLAGGVYAFLQSSTATNIQVASNAAEIAGLKKQYDLVVDRLGVIRGDQVKFATALTEVETQFCAADIIRNQMHVADMRIISILWEKVDHTRYPTDNAYYPTICNRPSAGSGR